MEKKESVAHAITQILAQKKVITESEAKALQRSFKHSQKENFDDFLLEEGLVEEAALLEALAQYYQLPSIDVTGYFFDTLLLRNFPKDFLLRNRIIPLEMEDEFLTVVASEPDNPDLISGLGAYTNEDIQFRVGLGRDIADAVKEFYDRSPTDLLDDQDYADQEFSQEKGFQSLLHYEDEEGNPRIKPELDTDQED